ncbi:CpsD/CapB family tyrosine-protein kinase [Listeria booriae]|uniref:non-specific protein-tyrosine kinase n=1 Tax=Listeria booriae TaxID=1552123 RepID=A0A7X0XIB7_9LIST|nr:CpsD/CapB family tyrosine-protein kinase [Listeria booriae]MBC1561543.1 CpsD/CapB family tyrosine-protein kinase [Listeria booriae]MBC1574028.1 CpsD/CapB family tyrosine-protein kinase [Listeria booriae]MBC2321752.1 CpsD/CapB family tyrosine-protein kinase [Listeria booriae]MCD2205757.1 CpsD/CapB family tyrosine-protein kinase [Listeria booriae]
MKQSKKKDNRKKLITATNPNSIISEEFISVKTNIEFLSIESEKKVLMVTSAEADAGKSLIASNLAVVFAQQNKKTLLIDLDLRKPVQHHIFGFWKEAGVTEMLVNGAFCSEEIIKKTEVERLSLLPAGTIPPNPTVILSTQQLADIIKKYSQEYDQIIIDAPPVLVASDAQLITRLTDGIILVIKSGSSEYKKVMKAMELLNRTGSKIIGSILNRPSVEAGKLYYTYK